MSDKRIIRVLHCIHSLTSGGAERQLHLLANVSQSESMLPAIFCVNDNGDNDIGPLVKIYKSTRVKKYNFSIFPSLNNAIKDFHPDIIHAWLPGAVTIPAMLMAYYREIPCVYSYRTLMHFNRPLSVLEFIIAVATASKIVSNNPVDQSAYLYRWLYSIKKGTEIENSVLIDHKFKKTNIRKDTIKEFKILYVGRITREKNWGCLLKALPLIEPCYKWELSICGDGVELPKLLKLAGELKIRDNIKLLGYRANIYSIMQDSDVLILPSFWEGMSNVLLESMEIGLPCIVSDIYSNKRIIDNYNCALTFDPYSPFDLASVINRFFGDYLIRQRLAKNGWNAVIKYKPEVMAKKYHNIYSSMLNNI